MKNIKGRLLYPGFVACFLLIVLLSACDNGYQASVRGIWFSIDKDNKDKKIEEPIRIDSTNNIELFVFCDIPSSIKEVSLTYTYDSSKLNISGFFDEDENDKKEVDNGKTTGTMKQAVVNPLISITVKARNTQITQTEPLEITVTVEPGGHKAVCMVYTQ